MTVKTSQTADICHVGNDSIRTARTERSLNESLFKFRVKYSTLSGLLLVLNNLAVVLHDEPHHFKALCAKHKHTLLVIWGYYFCFNACLNQIRKSCNKNININWQAMDLANCTPKGLEISTLMKQDKRQTIFSNEKVLNCMNIKQ